MSMSRLLLAVRGPCCGAGARHAEVRGLFWGAGARHAEPRLSLTLRRKAGLVLEFLLKSHLAIAALCLVVLFQHRQASSVELPSALLSRQFASSNPGFLWVSVYQ